MKQTLISYLFVLTFLLTQTPVQPFSEFTTVSLRVMQFGLKLNF